MIIKCSYQPHKNSNLNNPGLQGLPLSTGGLSLLHLCKEDFIRAIDYLDVETSPRYQRHKDPYATFCNGYVTDFCGLFGIYLPKVWWYLAVIKIWGKTNCQEWPFITKGKNRTVYDVSANGLYDWLNSPYAAEFGWKKAKTLDELKVKAKNHALCVISAANRFRNSPEYKGNKSGHISMFFYNLSPDNPGGYDISQAGHNNYRLVNDDWWNADKFKGNVGFFYHE